MKSISSLAAVGLLSTPLLLATSMSQAVEFEAEIAPAYDDNPFRLSDDKDPDDGWFLQTDLKLQHEFNGLRLRARLDNSSYEGNLDDADETVIKLDARYRADYKLANRDTRSEVRLDLVDRDKTYISRRTGEIGRSGGQQIKDRYDYDGWVLRANSEVELNRQLDVGVELRYIERDYEDYSIPGLSNLDYEEWELSNEWEYDIDKQREFEVELWVSQREFDDKREKSLAGAKIPGSDLEYDYYGISLAYEYEFSRELEIELEYRYERRDDSGPGYYDLDDNRLSASIDYDPKGKMSYSAWLLWQDRSYDNDPSDFDEDEDGEPSRDGYTLKLEMERELTERKGFESAFFAGLRYDDYDSDDDDYEYDRTRIYAGVMLEFGE